MSYLVGYIVLAVTAGAPNNERGREEAFVVQQQPASLGLSSRIRRD
jgi:hypothetical protein